MASKSAAAVKASEATKTSETTAEPPAKTKKNSVKDSVRKVSKTAALIVAIVLFGVVALITTIFVVSHISSLRASEAEYEYLRERAGDVESESGEFSMAHLSALDQEMLQINPDYIFWMRIDGTNIDHPVVRGYDNVKYLDTSFSGEPNIAGALFVDYRNVGEIVTPEADDFLQHIVIYGHNLQRGGMFTDLRRLLNKQFLEENNIITLIINDEIVEFEIFSARLTSVHDPAYFHNFEASHSFPRFANRVDAPLIATQIITLSTCTSSGNDDSRLVVQGYRLFDW